LLQQFLLAARLRQRLIARAQRPQGAIQTPQLFLIALSDEDPLSPEDETMEEENEDEDELTDPGADTDADTKEDGSRDAAVEAFSPQSAATSSAPRDWST
jgi:hypothetical protein